MSNWFSSWLTGLSALVVALPFYLAVLLPLALVLGLFYGVFYLIRIGTAERSEKELSVLIVDDDESSILSLQSVLREARTKTVASADEMIEELKLHHYDLIFIDQMMPGLKGSAALTVLDGTLKNESRAIPVVFFTGTDQRFSIPRLKQFSVVEVWGKQMPYRVLDQKVHEIFKKIS